MQSEFMPNTGHKNKNWGKEDTSWDEIEQDTTQDTTQVHLDLILLRQNNSVLFNSRSRQEIMDEIGFANRKYFELCGCCSIPYQSFHMLCTHHQRNMKFIFQFPLVSDANSFYIFDDIYIKIYICNRKDV